jgi:hypothetical protein
MALKSEKIKIDGVEYVVNELPVKQFLPMVEKLSEGSAEGQIMLLGAAVHVGGKPIGEGAGDLGASVFMPLVKRVLKVNGMEQGEGNGA